MLKISFEFRKGIFFIRLIGDLNKKSYTEKEKEIMDLIINNQFKYIVINTNYLNSIDIDGLNYLTRIYYLTKENKSNLVICDKFKIAQKIFNYTIPSIETELEVL